MSSNIWITTDDNPFDPFTQFDEWYAFDISHGYNTCSYVARIAKTSDELSQADDDDALNAAIDDIARLNITGRYKIISEPPNIH